MFLNSSLFCLSGFRKGYKIQHSVSNYVTCVCSVRRSLQYPSVYITNIECFKVDAVPNIFKQNKKCFYCQVNQLSHEVAWSPVRTTTASTGALRPWVCRVVTGVTSVTVQPSSSPLRLQKSKGKFLYSAVPNRQNCSKRFTLYFPDRRVTLAVLF